MNERSVFVEALEIENPAERTAYLDQACGADSELRRRVERLLQTHQAAGGILDRPPLELTGTYRPITEGPGAVIGPYKLLQKIGEGGFGVVFMAEQGEPIRRNVALKIIKPGMDTAQVIARFESERQALAIMDHPNIAKVLDADATESGRPYFVMELVKGVPITEFCDKSHMPAEGRLKLFIDVCHAIQHAHHKGVIHRDIKPSNVMVTLHDGVPVVKVIDFGVAKATVQKLTEKTLFTAYGQMIGTPAYMSPEQAEMSGLDIDTRSDVYSLGVLLYELLTGTTPLVSKRLREAGYAEMQRLIREEEAPRPSNRLSSLGDSATVFAGNRGLDVKHLVQLLAGDLDWVVMKALDKDRNRRYGTPGSFAEDIERYLRHDAILARPPSAIYKLRKFVRRNRVAVFLTTFVPATALAVLINHTVGYYEIRRERDEKEQARKDEAEQRQRAEAAQKKAEQAEADTLADYRASTDDAIEQLIGSKPELGPKEKTYLENTLKRWQAFAARQGDDERSRAIRAEGHYRVAFLWDKLDCIKEARAEYQAARDIRKRLVEQFPAVPAHQQELASTYNNLGILLRRLGEREEAREEYQAARYLRKRLAEQFPAVPGYQQNLAGTHNNLGNLLADLGKREEARAEYQAARDVQTRLVEQAPAAPAYQQDLARTHNNLGILLRSLGKHQEARAEIQAARELQQKLVEQLPAVPAYQQDLASTYNNLGNLLKELGKREEARAAYQAARDIQKRLVEQFPAVPAYQQSLASTHNNLGLLLTALEKREEARAEYHAARDIRKKQVEQFPNVPVYQQELATTHNNLGLLLAALEKREEARAEYQTARDIRKKQVERFPAVPAYQQELATTHNNLGNLLAALGKGEEARTEYQAARDIGRKLVEHFPTVPAYQIALGNTYCNYGILIRDEGKPAESLEWFERAIRTLNPVHGKEPRDGNAEQFLRNSHLHRARAYNRLQQPSEAVKDWDRAVELSPPAEQPGLRASRVISRVRAGMVAEAVAEVAELTAPGADASGSPKWNAGQWCDFACVYAVASKTGGINPPARQQYANRAMELLQKAVKAGYKDAAHLAKDKDLDALREREDFKKLLAELAKQPEPPRKQPPSRDDDDRDRVGRVGMSDVARILSDADPVEPRAADPLVPLVYGELRWSGARWGHGSRRGMRKVVFNFWRLRPWRSDMDFNGSDSRYSNSS